METRPHWLAADLIEQSGWLRRLARTLASDRQSGDDAVQDTFLAALSRPPAGDRPLRPWLQAVLRNFLRRNHRSRQRADRREQVSRPPVALPDAETLLAHHQALRLVAELVAELDEPFRATVLLCYGEGLAPTEVARRLGVPAGTVRWRLKTALDRLRSRLDERHGGDRRTWVLVLMSPGFAPDGSPASRMPLPAIVAVAVVAVVATAVVVGGVQLREARRARPVTVGHPVPLQRRMPSRFALATPPAQPALVSGRLRTADGSPIAAAHVALFAPRTPASAAQPSDLLPVGLTTSDAEGRFTLALAPGRYGLTATAPGFTPIHVPALTAGPRTPSLELVMLPGGVTLRGRVAEPAGTPVAGARIAALVDFASFRGLDLTRLFVTTTDGGGRYRLGLPAGTYSLLVAADGYGPQLRGVAAYGDDVRDFRLDPPGALTGRVLRRDGQPAAGAAIELLPATPGAEPSQAVADQAGVFDLRDLAPGRYRVMARSGPLLAWPPPFVDVLELQRTEGVVLVLDPGRVIEGRALAPSGGQVAGLELDLVMPGGSWQRRPEWVTAGDGRFRFEALPPGHYSIRVHEGAHDVRGEVTVDVNDGDAREVAVTLVPAATVRGRVLDPAGAPARGAQVLAWYAGSTGRGPRRVVADEDGAFLLRGLRAGALRLGAEDPRRGVVREVARLDLLAGATTEATLRLGPGVTVEGEVRAADGQLAAGALVRAYSSVAPRSTRTDSRGRFLLAHVPSSDVRLVATAEDAEVDVWQRPPGPDLVLLPIRNSVSPPPVSLTLPGR